MGRGPRRLNYGEVIYEFIDLGSAIKVTAVDPDTYTEVSIVGAPHASRDVLEHTVLRKLEYVLRKRGLIDPR